MHANSASTALPPHVPDQRAEEKKPDHRHRDKHGDAVAARRATQRLVVRHLRGTRLRAQSGPGGRL